MHTFGYAYVCVLYLKPYLFVCLIWFEALLINKHFARILLVVMHWLIAYQLWILQVDIAEIRRTPPPATLQQKIGLRIRY